MARSKVASSQVNVIARAKRRSNLPSFHPSNPHLIVLRSIQDLLQKGSATVLLDRLKTDFVVSVQIDPPGHVQIEEFSQMLSALKELGVSAVDVNSSRRLSHDSIVLSMMIQGMGFDTIPHITTRDSSINGLVNQILAAHSWSKITNFLLITGDPYEARQAIIPSKGVFQTDSLGALEAIDFHLRRSDKFGLDINLAAAINQNKRGRAKHKEGVRTRLKQQAGADFFMSQPVFDKLQLDKLIEFYSKHADVPLMVGIWPLVSKKTAEVIRAGRVVGVELPESLYYECQKYTDPASLASWGLDGALELINQVKQSKACSGVYIVAPLRNPLELIPLIKDLGL